MEAAIAGVALGKRKAMGYIIAVHVPITGIALPSPLTGLPLVLATCGRQPFCLRRTPGLQATIAPDRL